MRCWRRSARARRGRPVKVALQRPLMFNNTTHRPATIQRIRIGATRDGKITAIGHESWSGDLPGGKPEGAVEPDAAAVCRAQPHDRDAAGDAGSARRQRHARAGRGDGHDGAGNRHGRNGRKARHRPDRVPHPQRYPGRSRKSRQRPFSQRQLIECLRTGAERFGWSKRNPQPGRVRDGRWLVGIGTAAAFRNNLLTKSAARVRLDSSGIVTVETDMTDIGTGSYTIIAQTAAEMMGVPLEKVRGASRRFGLPGLGRFRRAMGRQQLHRGRLCRLRQVARGDCAETRLQFGGGAIRRWRGPRGQSQRAAGAGRRRKRPESPKTKSSMATSPRSTSNRPSARISSKSASMPRRPRSACGGCWRSAPPAASSIRRPRAAR